MELTTPALNLLRYVITVDGKKELNNEGKEVDSHRRLNGEESAQRRFFIRECDRLNEIIKPEADAITNAYNSLFDKKRDEVKAITPKLDGETEDAYNERIGKILEKDVALNAQLAEAQSKIKEMQKVKHSLTLTDKTLEVLKKYFKEFGDSVGYLDGDDAAVEELSTAFGM